MIIRDIKTNKLYDTKYLSAEDEYWILEGNELVRILKPSIFRYFLYDRGQEYVVEKDDK